MIRNDLTPDVEVREQGEKVSRVPSNYQQDPRYFSYFFFQHQSES
jgi:hypothetical protein